MEYDIKTIKKDDNGRYILMTGTFNTQELTLLNIYAPTGDKIKEQLQFIDTITEFINEHSNNLIVMGDFNTYLTNLDTYEKLDKTSEHANKINNILEDGFV